MESVRVTPHRRRAQAAHHSRDHNARRRCRFCVHRIHRIGRHGAWAVAGTQTSKRRACVVWYRNRRNIADVVRAQVIWTDRLTAVSPTVLPHAMLQPETAGALSPVVSLVQPWQSLYAGHSSVSTIVIFLHLGALLAAGGLAIANDRAIVRTATDDVDGRTRRLADLALSHRTVLSALSVSFFSGVLLFLADLEAFVIMPVFWVKMALILLLILNAALMMRQRETAAPVWRIVGRRQTRRGQQNLVAAPHTRDHEFRLVVRNRAGGNCYDVQLTSIDPAARGENAPPPLESFHQRCKGH